MLDDTHLLSVMVLCGMKILYNMIANVTNYSIKYLPRKTLIFYSIKWCAPKLEVCLVLQLLLWLWIEKNYFIKSIFS
jgi:hypothetical protein